MRPETDRLPGLGEAADVAFIGSHPDPVVGDDDPGLLEHGLLVPCVESLYQPFLVPLEVAERILILFLWISGMKLKTSFISSDIVLSMSSELKTSK